MKITIFKMFILLFWIIGTPNLESCKTQNTSGNIAYEADKNRPETPKQRYIYDYESILTSNQEADLTDILLQFQEKTQKEILIVTTHSIGNFPDIQTYAVSLGNIYTGEIEKDDIIIIAISKTLRKIGIATSDKAKEILTDKKCKNIINQKIIPNFKKGDFYNGIKLGINELIAKWSLK